MVSSLALIYKLFVDFVTSYTGGVMAITSYTVTDAAWVAITAAGKSGTCWLQKKPVEGRVAIHHSTTGSGSLSVNDGFFLPDNKSELTSIVADSGADIYYARCSDAGETATVITDVI